MPKLDFSRPPVVNAASSSVTVPDKAGQGVGTNFDLSGLRLIKKDIQSRVYCCVLELLIAH